jgi:hypothetical protein
MVQPGPAPIEEFVQLGYYDGLTDGVVRCKLCRNYYYVRAIAFWGGPTHGSRVFALYSMPRTSYAECEATRLDWRGAGTTGRRTADEYDALSQRMGALARRRRRPVRILCWDMHADALLAIRTVPEVPRLPGAHAIVRATVDSDRPWFRHLGLETQDAAG